MEREKKIHSLTDEIILLIQFIGILSNSNNCYHMRNYWNKFMRFIQLSSRDFVDIDDIE